MTKEFFTKGIIEIIDQEIFKKNIKSDKKLRIKYGVDPTKPDIHLGHAVQLWKLKELQEAGHTVIFLIGDYTTKIGDPSGRNTTRPVLTDTEIKANAKTYFQQVEKILDIEKTEVRYNSEWLGKLSFNDILQLASKFTVAQIIERDDFEKRLKAGVDISLHEILYPLMQAYDSVVLKADVEFGGSDQKFNLLAGRDLQRKMGQEPQDLIITELLVGTDGVNKMSKSLNNYIGITDSPNSQFGRIMSISDAQIIKYFELCTLETSVQIEKYKNALDKGENPRNIKARLAYEIVKLYHGKESATFAREEFEKVFSKKELPAEIPEVKISGSYKLPLLLIELGAVSSKSEARRMIEQGGLKVDNTKLTDPNSEITLYEGMIIQVGRLKYFKIR